MLLFDEIGYWGIRAQDVAEALDAAGQVSALDVFVNSPGGDVYDGVAIRNLLAGLDAEVTVTVQGIAASIASVIVQAGDRRVMNQSTEMMIHDPWAMTVGNAAEHRESADLLDRFGDTLAGAYQARAGGSLTEWRDAMRAETWYSPDEALAAGLVDEVAAGERVDGMAAKFDLSVFRFKGRAEAPEPRLAARRGEGEDAAPEPSPRAAAPEPADEPQPELEPDPWAGVEADGEVLAAALHAATDPLAAAVAAWDTDVFAAAVRAAVEADIPADEPPAAPPNEGIDPVAFAHTLKEALLHV